MRNTYLFIFFDIARPKDNRHAMRKSVTSEEFELLKTTPSANAQLESTNYEVIEKRSFSLPMATESTHVLICDVKAK